MANFQRGETVIIRSEVRLTSILTDPSEGVVVDLTNPVGTAVIEAQAMTNLSTGIYEQDFPTDEDSILGWYQGRFTSVDGTRVTIEDFGFELKP
jgi:hypothetical protein